MLNSDEKGVHSTDPASQTILDREKEQEVDAILARTDWVNYWEEVSSGVEREVEAYDRARARSLTSASGRFIR
ncbi:MAG: hypothetical protein G01um101472_426 [Parcubacteria group bacterium Gr01-1014_72]|nr:MAG: hypothetical protein G01um101472_426 [Parcubacteria group bacterium Gr01-1014_72]